MKRITLIFAFSLIALLLVGGSALAAMQSGGGYQIWADVISVGGIEQASSSGGFYLDDTIGEAVAGRSSTTNDSLRAGFQEMVRDILSLSLSTNSLDLGTLSTTTEKNASHGLNLNCNSATGVNVSFSGGTLTSGAGTITAMNPAAASTPGTSQFGFHVTGGVNALPVAPFNTAQYAFISGNNIVSSAGPTAGQEAFTVKYIANIAGTEPSGTYTTAIVYTALANF